MPSISILSSFSKFAPELYVTSYLLESFVNFISKLKAGENLPLYVAEVSILIVVILLEAAASTAYCRFVGQEVQPWPLDHQ